METQNTELNSEEKFSDRFWNELGQAKFNEEYLKAYCISRKEQNDGYKYAFVILSIIGLLLKNQEYGSYIVLIILTLISVGELIYKNLFPEKDSIGSLNMCLTFYNNYFSELESLWWRYREHDIEFKETRMEFFKIKGTENVINKLVNETINSTDEELKELATRLAANYLNNFF